MLNSLAVSFLLDLDGQLGNVEFLLPDSFRENHAPPDKLKRADAPRPDAKKLRK